MLIRKIFLAAMAILLLVYPVLAGTEKPAPQKMAIDTFLRLNHAFHSPADRSIFEGFEAGVFDAAWTVAGISTEKPWTISGSTIHGSIEGASAATVMWDASVPSNETLSFDYVLAQGDDQLSFWMAGSVGADWSLNCTETIEVTHAGGTTVVFDFDTAGATDNTWERWDIDLSAYDGEKVIITFRYEGVDGDLHVIDAVAIDDGTGWNPIILDPPENDTCDGAISLPLGNFSLTGDTSFANNNYEVGAYSCTGYQSAGPDVTYYTVLYDGAHFSVTMNADFDDSIYLVTDCSDVAGTCVAGADAYPSGSSFSYYNNTGEVRTFYLIVDAYGSGSGEYTIDGWVDVITITAEATTWGSMKSMYR